MSGGTAGTRTTRALAPVAVPTRTMTPPTTADPPQPSEEVRTTVTTPAPTRGPTPHTRGFRTGDGPQLLDAWQRSLPRDPISPTRFRTQVLLDANFDPEGLRVATHQGRVVGAAYGVRRRVPLHGTDLEPEQGWIPFFFVTPELRGRGLGRRLLGEVLDWLGGHGRTRVDFACYTPHYLLPGLDVTAYPQAARLLTSLGFRPVTRATAMDRDLVGHTVPAPVRRSVERLTAQGYRFGTPSDDELAELVRLAETTFSADWARTIRSCLTAGASPEQIVTVRAPAPPDGGAGPLVGWAMHGAHGDSPERFGPFGVHPDHRGTGLGRALLHLALDRMRARGLHHAWFLWTGADTPAGRLYRSSGFTTTRVFEVMRRDGGPPDGTPPTLRHRS